MKPKLVVVTTVPLTLATLLDGQPRALSRRYDVLLVSAPGPESAGVREREGVPLVDIDMRRSISPFADLRALWTLTRLLRRERPAVVQTYTPKAGLLGMIAAFLARVPLRVHGVVGMPLMEARGARRLLFRATERITYAFATHLTANSHGLARYVREELGGDQVEVLGQGSINGVDEARFRPRLSAEGRAEARARAGIGADDVVFGFVGRLASDKGIAELVDAFTRAAAEDGRLRLLVVGPADTTDPLPAATADALRTHPRIVRRGFSADVREALDVMDVFVLASYREGLPNVLLEAGASGLPLLATNVTGCNEVVVPGENGLLVPAKDVVALQGAMLRLARNADEREKLKGNARGSIVGRYGQRMFYEQLEQYYGRVLAHNEAAR